MGEQMVRDFIFPICEYQIDAHSNIPSFKQMLGTAFLIGSRGYALTAAHVLTSLSKTSLIGGLFVDSDNKWCINPLKQFNLHPKEDLAVFQLNKPPPPPPPRPSPLLVSDEWVGSSLNFMSFGYPQDILHEDYENRDEMGRVLQRPNEVYIEGYIRRRLTLNLPSIKGSSFLELSTLVGKGFSGSPIIEKQAGTFWQVIGIYVAEKINDQAVGSVGYAVRAESFANWVPEILDKPVCQERP